MQKPNSVKGIASLVNGNNVPLPDNNEGRSIMALLHDNHPELSENVLKEQPVLIDHLLNEQSIKELKLIKGRPTYDIPIDFIYENEDNIRYDYGEISLLAKSILANGLKFALTVFLFKLSDGKVRAKLLDGHRRIRSLKLLISEGHSIETAECFIVTSSMTEIEKVEFMFLSQDNKQLEPLEAADGFRKIKIENPKISTEKIAEKIGKSDRYVRDIMMLLDEPEPIRQLIKEKKILYTAVVELRRTEPDAEKRLQIILESIEQKGAFTTTDVRARKVKKDKEPTELEPHLEETGKAILGPVLWKFGNFIQEIKKGDVGAKEIKRKIAILQEQPDNPISVYAKLELFKNHLFKFFSDDLQEQFKIITQFLSGEIEEKDLLRIGEEMKVENENK